MEYLPEDKILKYNPDTLVTIRRLYNLDKPGQIDEAVDILDAWLKKQNHFTRKDFPRAYLERVIILLKGSVERAKAQMEKICTLRTLLPHFFENVNANKIYKNMDGCFSAILLPKLTKDNYRLYISRCEPVRFSSKVYLQIYIYNVLIYEYLKGHDYCNGLVTIIDVRDVNIMDLVKQINLVELKQIATIILEGFDTRVKNFYFISSSKTIDVLIKLFKQMISEKLGKRIHVLKDVEELHEHIPKELLPSDFGGNEKPLATLNDEFVEFLSSEENITYFKDMSNARTIESMRTSSTFNEEFLGLAGTFRTLNVD